MDEPESTERQLRQSTLSHQPGQYAEPESYGVQKPAFIWPDPVYDPELAVHCAFPTVPLDQPGPSEAFKAAREKARLENDGEYFLSIDTDDSTNTSYLSQR